MFKIALTGRARSGKDFLANEMRADFRIQTLAFGNDLKFHARNIFPHMFEGGRKPRKVIQDFGQMMRRIDENVWIRPVMNEIQRLERVQSDARWIDGIIVTDLRQPNELESLRAAGFTIVRVKAAPNVRYARMEASGDIFKIADSAHETESYIDGFDVDYEIENDGKADAAAQLREIIRKEYAV